MTGSTQSDEETHWSSACSLWRISGTLGTSQAKETSKEKLKAKEIKEKEKEMAKLKERLIKAKAKASRQETAILQEEPMDGTHGRIPITRKQQAKSGKNGEERHLTEHLIDLIAINSCSEDARIDNAMIATYLIANTGNSVRSLIRTKL